MLGNLSDKFENALRKLSEFYRVPVCAVVSGSGKRDIVTAAARGRYVNTAVMETELARSLVD